MQFFRYYKKNFSYKSYLFKFKSLLVVQFLLVVHADQLLSWLNKSSCEVCLVEGSLSVLLSPLNPIYCLHSVWVYALVWLLPIAKNPATCTWEDKERELSVYKTQDRQTYHHDQSGIAHIRCSESSVND